MLGRGLVGEASAKQSRGQRVPRTVAREHAPCAVSPVGSRRQTYHQESRVSIAEAWHRPPPVFPIPEGPPLSAGHLLTISHQPGAGLTNYDLVVQFLP